MDGDHGPRAFDHEFPEFEEVEDAWFPWRWWLWRLFMEEPAADAMEDRLGVYMDRGRRFWRGIRRASGELAGRIFAAVEDAADSIVEATGGMMELLWRADGRWVWQTVLRTAVHRRRSAAPDEETAQVMETIRRGNQRIEKRLEDDTEHASQLLELD